MSITPKVVVKAVNKDAEEAISRKILRLLVSAGIKTFKQTEVEIRNGLVDVHFNVLEKDLEKSPCLLNLEQVYTNKRRL